MAAPNQKKRPPKPAGSDHGRPPDVVPKLILWGKILDLDEVVRCFRHVAYWKAVAEQAKIVRDTESDAFINLITWSPGHVKEFHAPSFREVEQRVEREAGELSSEFLDKLHIDVMAGYEFLEEQKRVQEHAQEVVNRKLAEAQGQSDEVVQRVKVITQGVALVKLFCDIAIEVYGLVGKGIAPTLIDMGYGFTTNTIADHYARPGSAVYVVGVAAGNATKEVGKEVVPYLAEHYEKKNSPLVEKLLEEAKALEKKAKKAQEQVGRVNRFLKGKPLGSPLSERAVYMVEERNAERMAESFLRRMRQTSEKALPQMKLMRRLKQVGKGVDWITFTVDCLEAVVKFEQTWVAVGGQMPEEVHMTSNWLLDFFGWLW
jgi:hypothetical protein